MRECVIERYLHKQVVTAGGTTRKMKGRINDPDRLVIWPGVRPRVHFVELKAPAAKARAAQVREHQRLRRFGCAVFVINTLEGVDAYVRAYRT